MPSFSSRSALSDDDGGSARRLAHGLLGGGVTAVGGEGRIDHPALAWRRAGLFDVTGAPEGEGLVSPVALTSLADGALLALRTLAPDADLPANGAGLLGERARRLGFRRRGQASANGSARLLETADGHLALNLPRTEDWASLEALLGRPAADWPAIAACLADLRTADVVAQGRLLGMAIAPERDAQTPDTPLVAASSSARGAPSSQPLVVDLSALWAGPLAASLLGMAGARVVKVESRRRPDGARGGDPGVYDLLNAGKASVALDFSDAADVARLRALIEAADIIVESTRPRALEHLGIDAALAVSRGATWLSITAYGRMGEEGERIGFGDDAAVAGGLSAAMRRAWGESLFAGDAIADPLSGIVGALAALSGWQGGGGRLISVALADVVAHACASGEAGDAELQAWQAMAAADAAPLYPLRTVSEAARPLGADTAAVFARL